MQRDVLSGSASAGGHTGPGGRAARAPAASVLALQRGAGNRAVTTLARKQAAKPARPAATGLRKPDAIERYARKAVSFWRRNPDTPVERFVIYLGAAVNTELEAAGVPPIKTIVGTGMAGAAGEFSAEFWTATLNPEYFVRQHRRASLGPVIKLSDLDEIEAGLLAARMYHEARHAEQGFRVARHLASEARRDGAESVADQIRAKYQIDEDVAAAAGADPLTARSGARERAEARLWRENVAGADATYREAVTWWLGEAKGLARMISDVDEGDLDHMRATLLRRIKSWANPDGAAGFVRAHIHSATKRRSARAGEVRKEIGSIDAAFRRAQLAVRDLEWGWTRRSKSERQASFKPVHDALVSTVKALDASYHHQPVEHDAHAGGDAVFYAFERLAKKKPAR